MTTSILKATDLLSAERACTDAEVAALEQIARQQPSADVFSDLAAAYLVRAQRNDEPLDLLRAHTAAEQAYRRSPSSLQVRFNLALAQEALGMSAEATQLWDALRRDDAPQWAAEAGEHWRRLSRESLLAAATQWPLNRDRRLPLVIEAGDRESVRRLIEPFPAAAQRHVEEDLLPRWAEATERHDSADAHTQLAHARSIATELVQITGDRYLLDAVDRAEKGIRTKDLIAGHLAFSKARVQERELGPLKAKLLYADAAKSLDRAGSPLQFAARLGIATALSFESGKMDRATALLAPLEDEARSRHYSNIVGRVHAMRAFFLLFQSRYLDSLNEYDAALSVFHEMHDLENVANAHTRKSGVLRALGQAELAWREAFQAQRYASHVVDIAARHHLLGETGAAALAAGHPSAAIIYSNSAVAMLQKSLSIPETSDDDVNRLQKNLSIAMRGRAAIQLHLDKYEEADRDLAESIRLANIDPNPDEGIRRGALARTRELEGISLLSRDPANAVPLFTEALRLAAAEEFRTFRAMLLTERADAYRRSNRKAESKRDLEAALEELKLEEKELLEHRSRGSAEAVWTSYFQRFRPTYDRLVGQMVEDGRTAEAFAYAERAKAFEPLDLVRQLNVTPKQFLSLVPAGEPMELSAIRKELPYGTYLIDYFVLDHETFVWIVSHDNLQFLSLPVNRADIEAWSATLQLEARQINDTGFRKALEAPSAALIEAPLALIDRDAGRGEQRLIFIPDRAMHGLPFSALRDREGRYVLQHGPIAVAASATLYVFSLLRDRAFTKLTPRKITLVGDPAFDRRMELARGLSRLRNARQEVESIAMLYGNIARKLVENEATVPNFLELAPGSTVIHVAGHAIANPRAPFRSLLLLAPSRGETGALEAEELLTRLHIDQTRLVVLSACNTAGGQAIGPEGLSPLVRPLVAAGVPAVVGSLWTIDDAGSETLLVRFHYHYRKGEDAATALRNGQMELLSSGNPGLETVLAWAPFEVIGYADSPFRPH